MKRYFVYDIDKAFFVNEFMSYDAASNYALNLSELHNSDAFVGELPRVALYEVKAAA